jgi:3'(2'), 5'-bisphosphate nucleotidase
MIDLNHAAPLLEELCAIARAAGDAVLEVYGREFKVQLKDDSSPLTEADQVSHRIIVERLRALDDTLPLLSEESAPQDVAQRRAWQRYWLVDPLDGTKEFLKRNGEFTVNIALIESGRPTYGVILAPASGATYLGSPAGAFEINYRNDLLPLRTNPNPPMRVVASRSHGHDALKGFCDAFLVTDDVSVGSSLKFCLVAKGEAQLYPRFTPTSEWDTAAGQAILEAAGGAVLMLDGRPLTYGRGGDHLNPFFIAAATPDMAAKAASEMQKALSAA